MDTDHVDVLILGAGLSGIGAACHLQRALPGKSFAILEARGRDRRHLGPLPLPGHPLGLGHVHARLLLPALGGRPSRSPTAPRSCATSATPHAITASTSRSASATARCAPNGPPRRRAGPSQAERALSGETVRLTCGFLYVCTGYYRYDEGYSPRFEGTERFARPDRPSPALARGPRLLRQAHRRDRQRRHRGHARARAGRARRARDDAAALSRLHPRRSPARDPLADRLRRRFSAARTYSIVRWKNVLLTMLVFQLCRRAPDADEHGSSARSRASSFPPATTSTRTSRRATSPGTSASAWCPTATSSRPSRGGARSIVTGADRDASPRTGVTLASGEELAADVIVTATGLNVLMLGGMSSPSTAPNRSRRDRRLQGHDAVRRPERRAHARLHERLLDAQGRPRGGVRLPAAGAHGPSGARRSARRGRPDQRCRREPMLDLKSGYVLRSIEAAAATGQRGRPGAFIRTTSRTSPAQARVARRRDRVLHPRATSRASGRRRRAGRGGLAEGHCERPDTPEHHPPPSPLRTRSTAVSRTAPRRRNRIPG